MLYEVITMRLSPPGNKKFIQANTLEFCFGGTELNVGLSIANFGGNVKHITVISDDFIGDTAISYLNKFDLDTTAIVRSNRPLGVYFLEVRITSYNVCYTKLLRTLK